MQGQDYLALPCDLSGHGGRAAGVTFRCDDHHGAGVRGEDGGNQRPRRMQTSSEL